MRNRVALAAGAVVLVAVAAYVGFRIVSGGDSAAAIKDAKACPEVRPPKVALAIRPATEPAGTELDCDIRGYTNFVGPPSWDAMARAVTAAGNGDHAWQERILLWGYPSCTGCLEPVLDLKNVMHDHPDWILRNVAGQAGAPARATPDGCCTTSATSTSRPPGQTRWSPTCSRRAAGRGSTSSTPATTRTGRASRLTRAPATIMTDSDRVKYLAQALTLVTERDAHLGLQPDRPERPAVDHRGRPDRQHGRRLGRQRLRRPRGRAGRSCSTTSRRRSRATSAPGCGTTSGG